MQLNEKNLKVALFLKSHKDLWKDTRGLKSLLADIIPEDKSTRHILQISYDEGIADALLESTDLKRVIYNYQKVMVEDYFLNRTAANLAICIWLEVLGYSYLDYSDILDNDSNVNGSVDEQPREKEIDTKYMREAKFYNSIVDLNDYLSDNPTDEKARYEYISLLFDTLVEPEYVFKSGEAEYIASLCIDNINKLKEQTDELSRYRLLRAKYAKASCLMIVGDLIAAYDLFCEITKPIDDLAREMKETASWPDILFRCEANIHQIKELCGVDDGSFFSEYREEIKFFEAHVDQIVFTYEDSYCLPILIPLAREYRNAFYQTFNSNGKAITSFGHGGQFFALNQARMGYSGKYSVTYWPINLYSGVSRQEYADWTWSTIEKKLDRNAIQSHIANHPYKKVNGYIAPLIASNNRRTGRS